MKLNRKGNVQPFCACGECVITVSEQNSDGLENVRSGRQTAMEFVDPDVYVDDCELVKVEGAPTGWVWGRD